MIGGEKRKREPPGEEGDGMADSRENKRKKHVRLSNSGGRRTIARDDKKGRRRMRKNRPPLTMSTERPDPKWPAGESGINHTIQKVRLRMDSKRTKEPCPGEVSPNKRRRQNEKKLRGGGGLFGCQRPLAQGA